MWQQHDCLFNVSCKTYRNRAAKEKSWAEVAVEVSYNAKMLCATETDWNISLLMT